MKKNIFKANILPIIIIGLVVIGACIGFGVGTNAFDSNSAGTSNNNLESDNSNGNSIEYIVNLDYFEYENNAQENTLTVFWSLDNEFIIKNTKLAFPTFTLISNEYYDTGILTNPDLINESVFQYNEIFEGFYPEVLFVLGAPNDNNDSFVVNNITLG